MKKFLKLTLMLLLCVSFVTVFPDYALAAEPGDVDDDLILVDVALQQLGIAGVGERRGDDTDVVAAFDGLSDIAGDHVQLNLALQLGNVALQVDGLGLEDLLHRAGELRHFVQIDGMALQRELSGHGMSAVTAAQNSDLLGVLSKHVSHPSLWSK